MNHFREYFDAAVKDFNLGLNLYEMDFEDNDGNYVFGYSISDHKPDNDADFQVAIIPTQVEREVQTLGGPRKVSGPGFYVFYPIYESGDWSVGIPDGYYVVVDDVPDVAALNIPDAIAAAVTWILNHFIQCRLDNFAEYLAWKDAEEMANNLDK